MSDITYAGVDVQCNEEGYLTDLNQWNKEVALDIAKEEGIDLEDMHWEVLEYVQSQYKK